MSLFGITWLAPGYLWGALAAAVVVVGLHLLAWRRPKPSALPTARFVPDQPVRAVSRAVRPRDFVLLALRAAAVLAAGAALARPVIEPARVGTARVVLLDQSRAVADPAAAATNAAQSADASTALILFDSTARVVSAGAVDSLTTLARAARRSGARGSLSSALIAAEREGRRLRRTHERVELAIVSPLSREELDDATLAIRALWPDSIAIIRVAAATDVAGGGTTEVVGGGADDPLAALLGVPQRSGATTPSVRIVRGPVVSTDSAWARDTAHVLVIWPRTTLTATVSGPTAREPVDAVFAAAVDLDAAVTLVGTMRRAPVASDATPIAWWRDGAVAATERATGNGCVREVGIRIAEEGDLWLTPRFARLVSLLTAPCGGRPAFAPLADATLQQLRAAPAAGAPRDRAARVVEARAAADPEEGTDARRWLLAAALLLLAVEPLARRSVA